MELVYPTRCVVCEKAGSLLCGQDRSKLVYIDHTLACPRCGAPFGRKLCTECVTREGFEEFAFQEALSVLVYNKVAESLVRKYKDENERRLATVLAGLTADALPLEWRLWADGLSWIPADSNALQRRGFDHIKAFSYELSVMLDLPVYDLLDKAAKTDQRALTRALRRENAFTLFSVKTPGSQSSPLALARLNKGLKYKNLILLDDVFTTGATLDAASTVLKAAGFGHLRALTVARVW